MIQFVTPYGRSGGSSRVRVWEWVDRLEGEVEVMSYASGRNAAPAFLALHPAAVARAELRLRALARQSPESVFLHREASPFSGGRLEERLLRSARFSIFDFDDALHLDVGQGRFYRRLAPKSAKAAVAVRTADRVIAGNATLADWASSLNADVSIVPSCVAPEHYRPKSSYELADPPRLGWIGSPNNERYLLLVRDVLSELHRRTGARLLLIGTTTPKLGRLESMIDRVAWSEETQHTLLATVDVGLFPVPDVPYSTGKSGYKLLQYAAAGVPAVATPIGVNKEILARMHLPAADTPHDWLDAVDGLLQLGESERQALGTAARQTVVAEYSFDAWLPVWKRLVEL